VALQNGVSAELFPLYRVGNPLTPHQKFQEYHEVKSLKGHSHLTNNRLHLQHQGQEARLTICSRARASRRPACLRMALMLLAVR